MEKKSKAGRPLAIETPDELWELFLEYMDWAKSNPVKVQDYVGKDANLVYREKERPLTLAGFSSWLYKQEILRDVEHYFTNYKGSYDRFLDVCMRIKTIIRADQVEGGLVGIYNANITARVADLVDKQESKVTVEAPLFGDDGSTGA